MDEIRISMDAAGPQGEIAMVRVDGVIDTMTASELEKVMNKLLEQSRYRIVIDLGGVDYISSAGWGIFISNIREIRQHAGDLKLSAMVPNVYEIYKLLEFDSILRSYDSAEKAKNDFLHDVAVPQSVTANPGPPLEGVRPQAAGSVESAAEGRAPEKAPSPLPSGAPTPGRTRGGEADDSRVLELVREDPFLSIFEMKKILNSEAAGRGRLGWWKIRGVLKRHGLLSKRMRFRFARSRQ